MPYDNAKVCCILKVVLDRMMKHELEAMMAATEPGPVVDLGYLVRCAYTKKVDKLMGKKKGIRV